MVLTIPPLFDLQTKSLITGVPYFQALDDDGLKSVAQEIVVRHYSAGEVIFLEGDPGRGLHLVVKGLCKIYHLSIEGSSALCVIASIPRGLIQDPFA